VTPVFCRARARLVFFTVATSLAACTLSPRHTAKTLSTSPDGRYTVVVDEAAPPWPDHSPFIYTLRLNAPGSGGRPVENRVKNDSAAIDDFDVRWESDSATVSWNHGRNQVQLRH
jgi:hypothetical protein